MSLVVIKVDRTAKTHSIYSDGIKLSDSNIINANSNKICHIGTDKYDILIGCTGSSNLLRYIRVHLKEKLSNNIFSDFQTEIDLVEEEICNIFKTLWIDFCEENKLLNDNQDYNLSCIISINGYMFLIQHYNGTTFDSILLSDDDFCTTGQDEIAAKCMLYNNVPIQQIFDTISRYNCHVNNNVHSIENVSYLK